MTRFIELEGGEFINAAEIVKASGAFGKKLELTGGRKVDAARGFWIDFIQGTIIPAAPGYFAIRIAGDPPTLENPGPDEIAFVRLPIIAWHVVAPNAWPVTPGDFAGSPGDGVLAPDGSVSYSGRVFSSVSEFEAFKRDDRNALAAELAGIRERQAARAAASRPTISLPKQ